MMLVMSEATRQFGLCKNQPSDPYGTVQALQRKSEGSANNDVRNLVSEFCFGCSGTKKGRSRNARTWNCSKDLRKSRGKTMVNGNSCPPGCLGGRRFDAAQAMFLWPRTITGYCLMRFKCGG